MLHMKIINSRYHFIILTIILVSKAFLLFANTPDSAYIYAYSTTKNLGRNGLHFAWSIDRTSWHAIGPEHSFLKCDYGNWGTEKKMTDPFLFRDDNDIWQCVWSVNEYDGTFAHASSCDLVNWKPQSYPIVVSGDNCKELVIQKIKTETM